MTAEPESRPREPEPDPRRREPESESREREPERESLPREPEREPPPPRSPYGGLCAECVHARVIRSDRGSVFVLCEQARVDPRFPRYPPQPVVACPGFRR